MGYKILDTMGIRQLNQYLRQIIASSFLCFNAIGYSGNITDDLYVQIAVSENFEGKLEAINTWLPIGISSHDVRTHPLLLQLKEIALNSKSRKAQGIYHLNNSYFLAESHADYNSAFIEINKAIDIFNKPIDKRYLAQCYHNLAFIILWNKISGKVPLTNDDVFNNELQKALKYSIELKDKNLEVRSLEFLGSYLAVNMPGDTSSLTYYLKAEKLIDSSISPEKSLTIYASLAIIYADANNENLMKKYILKTEQNVAFNVFLYSKGNMYRAVSNYYLKHNQYNNALKYAMFALDNAYELNAPEYIGRSHQRLYEVYKAMANVEKALYHLEKYKFHEDSLNRQLYNKTLLDYDLAKKNVQIRALENQNLMVLQKEQRANIWMLLSFLCFGLITITMFVFYSKKLNKINAKNLKKINETEKEIQAEIGKEHSRIATEIESGIVQKLSALGWQLEALSEETKDEDLPILLQAKQLAFEAKYDLKLFLLNFNPPDIEAYGLLVSLKTWIKQYNAFAENRISISSAENIERLSMNVENKVYHILKQICLILNKETETDIDIVINQEEEKHLFYVTIKDKIGKKENGLITEILQSSCIKRFDIIDNKVTFNLTSNII